MSLIGFVVVWLWIWATERIWSFVWEDWKLKDQTTHGDEEDDSFIDEALRVLVRILMEILCQTLLTKLKSLSVTV
jgi:hypothetical protein